MSTHGRRLGDHYPALEPQERFRAALEADARGDEEEHRRLVDTCPRMTYRMSDAEFLDRVDAAHSMAMAVAIDLGPRLAKLRMCLAVRETLPHAVALGVDVGVGQPGELTPKDVREIVNETIGKAFDKAEDWLRCEAAAVYEAFALTCREHMGLEPDTVFKATLGPLYLDMLGLDMLGGAAPDKTQLDGWREMFSRKWREQVG